MKSTWPEVTLTLTTHSSSSRHQITVRCSQCISKYPSHVSIDRQTTYHYRVFGNRKYARRTGNLFFKLLSVIASVHFIFRRLRAPILRAPDEHSTPSLPTSAQLSPTKVLPCPPLYSLNCSHLNSVPSLFRARSVFPSRYAGKS